MDLSERTDGAVSRHPWELSRRDMVLRELRKLDIHGDVLDIGCGDGFFDYELLKSFPNLQSVWGIDIYAEKSVHDEKAKMHFVRAYEELGERSFDFILMMDVIEHIEDDAAFLNQIKKYMKEDCVVFITVPAFQSLYSLHDKELRHFRRYNFKTLKNVLAQSSFKILGGGMSYFYFNLILMRLLTLKKSENLSMWTRDEKNIVTRFVRFCLNMDFFTLRFLSRFHIYLPGLSLMAIAKSEEKDDRKIHG